VETAIQVLKEVLAESPDNLKANAVLGGFYADQGNMDDALIQLGVVKGVTSRLLIGSENGTKDEAGLRAAENYLAAEIAMAKGEYMDAVDKLSDVVSNVSIPDRMYFVGMIAEALMKAQKPDSAVNVLSAALDLNPNSGICLRFLAGAYEMTGNKTAQRDVLTRYLAVMKDADEGIPNVLYASAALDKLNR
jgi:predicted Zn-dependent protease